MMTRKEQLKLCKICNNRKMSNQGLVCSLTDEKATFEESCLDFSLDEKAAAYERGRDAEVEASEENDFFSPENKGLKAGVLGGIAMMVIAVVWFVVGYSAGVIFYYPPVLFIIGVVGLVKGLIEGNYNGNKSV